MKTTALIALSVIALIGCGKSQESYTSDYLYANDDIRAKVLAECAENKQSDTNCKNANDADGRKKVDEYRKQTNR
ncbi:EexN family lipoprotein (plasmid) [Moraxella bovis]|uniref:EexN family lipoprotein n=1 Tax=Moraxella bovis TaxID=476 RepID=UPI002226D631|nr:EexN family lipoprotein [Moraxella bovis]UZA49984.1 EexN family lipoprotein [Moraxella bovis]